jgi:hypothetical protein
MASALECPKPSTSGKGKFTALGAKPWFECSDGEGSDRKIELKPYHNTIAAVGHGEDSAVPLLHIKISSGWRSRKLKVDRRHTMANNWSGRVVLSVRKTHPAELGSGFWRLEQLGLGKG